MEDSVHGGFVRQLGFSRSIVTLHQLQELYRDAKVKPAVVQQHFIRTDGWNWPLLRWCFEVGIYVQSTRTLSDEPWLRNIGKRWLENIDNLKLKNETNENVEQISEKYGVSPHALFLRYVMGWGVVPLMNTLREGLIGENHTAWGVPLNATDYRALH